ncbi:MAG: tetratricopeptide repeat protein [Candidatus Gastranaerophilales bacterium]|nr:tetratricopeptide repeat protein [Candidatus Gastranaerophilales bacterium]
MVINKNNVLVKIAELNSCIQTVIDSDFNIEYIEKIISDYLIISKFLVSQNDSPENVLSFLIAGEELIEIDLPSEYEPLKHIYKLYSYIKQYTEDNIKSAIQNNNFDKIFELLSIALKCDIKNIILVNYIVEAFEKNELYKELIDLYKLMFVYDLNPLYFEKIGDIYYKQEEYQEALDSYLNCAELSDDYAEIYRKLANVFEKINDNESKLACIKQADTIEGKNES